MVYIARKKVKGKTYLYLTKKSRVDGKPRVVWQKYLGSEENIDKLGASIDTLHQKTSFKIKDYGLPMALIMYAERLGFVKIINEMTNKREQGLSVGDYMLIATLNRCIKPTSKNQMKNWFDSTYLRDKFPEIHTYLDSNAYTNHFKYLNEEIIQNIEEAFQKRLVSEYQLDISNIFYDPTNYYTFINPSDQELPRHGNSKEGRFTLNLIGMSLFCTHDGGIPFMHKAYPGNVMDANLFKSELPRILERLKNLGFGASNVTIMFDKGNSSSESYDFISKSGINFICSARPSSFKDLHHLKAEEFEIQKLPNGKKVGVKEYLRKIHEKPFRLIISYNPNQNKWNGSVKMKKIKKNILEAQEYFKDRLNIKKWRDSAKVEQRLLTFIDKSDHLDYINYSISGEYGCLELDVSINLDLIDKHLETLGKSYFLTNRADLSPLEVVWLYRQQYTVENAFKMLKRPDMLQIRPMYHYLDSSIRGHIFSVVSGLLLITLLHRDAVREFSELSLINMIQMLNNIKVIEVVNGKNIQYQLTGTNKSSERLLQHLKLDEFIKN